MKSMFPVMLILLLLGLLACGQKGDLVLPDEETAPTDAREVR